MSENGWRRKGEDGRQADLSAGHQQLAARRGVRAGLGDPARGAPPRLQRAPRAALLLDVPVTAPAVPRGAGAGVRAGPRHPDLRVDLADQQLPLAQHGRRRGRRLPQAAHRRGRRVDRRDRGRHGRPVRPRDRPSRLHEHGGHARRDPPPGGSRTRHDAAAVLRTRHRTEDVRQREARRQHRGVPAALPAVHAAREDLRLRRPRARRRRGRVDLGGADRRVDRGVPGVPARAHGALPQRLQPAGLPGAAGRVRQPRRGAGRVPDRSRRRATESPSRSRRRTGSTRSSRSAASSPTGSGSTPCCARRRSTSSTRRRSSPW